MTDFKERRKIIAEIKEKKEKDEIRREKYRIYRLKFLNFLKKLGRGSSVLLSKIGESKKDFLLFLKVKAKKFFLFLKHIGQNNIKIWGLILNRTDNFFNNFATIVSKFKYPLIGIFILIGIFSNVKEELNRFNNENLMPEVRELNFYPVLSLSNLSLSKKLMDWGYYDLSLDFLKKSKGRISFRSAKVREIENYVLLPSRQMEIGVKIEKLSKGTPYSWQVVLLKSKTEYELNKKEELENSLALLRWLNPKAFSQYQKKFE